MNIQFSVVILWELDLKLNYFELHTKVPARVGETVNLYLKEGSEMTMAAVLIIGRKV